MSGAVTYEDNFVSMRMDMRTIGAQAEIGKIAIDMRRSYSDGNTKIIPQSIDVTDGPEGNTDAAFESLVHMLTDRHVLALAAASAKVVAARGL